MPIHDHTLCGWRVASSLPLPDLLPWTGDDRAPDLIVNVGAVPERLDDPTIDLPLLQIDANGTCRFAMPGVATYLIDPTGHRVIVEPVLPADAPDIRVFLLGTVFGILCYRRGLLPLHASCVRVGGGAVALAGASGIGKSTLAASLLRRGHMILADDVTVIDTSDPAGPRVLPGFPRLKLWRDAMDRLQLSPAGLERTRSELAKFHVPVAEGFCAQPLPLTAVFHLDPDTLPPGGTLRRLRGPEAVVRVERDLYRRGTMVKMGLSAQALGSAVAVVGVPGGTWLVPHRHEPGGLEDSIAGILERLTA
ncbi:hypothetical protein HL658_28245 [Azospirillum sp. RWY-5-1]|uniref:HPr kinase/phosphorylase C-terminal domain-containing protein n=1 Tax=Azospirillum oleiclasticum TaxID=2735135 RepID=A0ABX2TIG5_9PROT|nr:hypothetical protein [Azospirillum oleiclasticum]NYZ16452.1 hypothetical protein [Azospirillum oleiclasticum]NYZ23832.1 hypothetical protein [Azospirillum oleiclasticum]